MIDLAAPARSDEWRADAVDQHLVSFFDPGSIEADQYRTLRHVIESYPLTPPKVIAVTSAVAGDGKTTTVLNLAGTLARAPGARILVIDLDLRTRTLGTRLGLRSQTPGFVDLILDSGVALEDAVREHPRFRLSVLPAGPVVTVPYEVLKSSRVGQLLGDARERYDYVLIDTPPLVVPDFRLIANIVDGILVVVAAHRTPRKLLEEGLNQLDGSKVTGFIFNGDDQRFSGHYGYYYGYYHADHRARRRWSRRWAAAVELIRRIILG